MNRRQWLSVWGFAIGTAALPLASAQTHPGSTTAVPTGEPVLQRSASGIDYISGGVGEEERTAMMARRSEFPFAVVFEVTDGEYQVADRLSVKTPQGDLLIVRDAGPIVMMKLPAGRYMLEADIAGRTEQRAVNVAGAAQTVRWRSEG
ncbi:MAG: hypothetical protein ABIV63_11255 [Caldimonas sp.]